MKKGLSEIVFILDKSGSMDSLIKDVIGGFNSFIREQKKVPGEAHFSLVTFSEEPCVVFNRLDIKEIPELTTETYKPYGGTALLDCIGTTIDNMGKTLAKTSEDSRPEHVIFAIMTDGEENRSRIYSKSQIAEKIKHQTEKYSWDFIYLGANQDSFTVSDSMGISKSLTGNYDFNERGINSAYLNISNNVTRCRMSSKI